MYPLSSRVGRHMMAATSQGMSIDALIQAAQYLEENGREFTYSNPPCTLFSLMYGCMGG